jgi:hypothetical protein
MAGKGSLIVVDKAVVAGGADLGSASAAPTNLNKRKAAGSGSASRASPVDDAVTDMMRKLNLTQQEATPFVLEDEGDDEVQYPDWALVGKVLNPTVLHINTIRAIVRPAWGEP